MAAGDIVQKWGSSAALTITLASLATDANLLTGRESTAVVASSASVTDYLIGGKITTGTSPTANKSIEIWLIGTLEDTPTWPDVFDGIDSAETITSNGVKYAICKLVKAITIESTSDRTYWFGPESVAQRFGNSLPKQWGVFVTHDTAVNLNATAGNHAIWATPVYANAAAA